MYRDLFPILDQQVYGHPLVYLDNAATTQKPRQVVETMNTYYLSQNSNIHRGTHYLAEQATERYEAVRRQVQRFIGAAHSHEIIFTRGTTESINLVAASFGQRYLHEGDEVVVSEMEHHSNIVPWQLACQRQGATLRVLPFDERGVLRLDRLEPLLNEHTRLVAVGHVSNTLGTVNPVRDIVDCAHRHGVPVLVDGAQAIAHMAVDVQALDCDFYCFSAHKMYGPMGVGVLYGRERWLEEMPPYQGGGEMIKEVRFEGTSFNELPFKFEAGTPAVAEVLGLGSAIDFMLQAGVGTIARHEQELLSYASSQLKQIDGLHIYGTAPDKTAVISFLAGTAHPYDTGTLLDKLGIAVRTGHHCTQPVMDHYGIPGTVRASFAIYNTRDEVDALVSALRRIAPMLM
ncbi:MAG: cysteine desulfurase / selenocysteine lyase [bacterium P3]|nr:MAG: cysteine desulfurase / selenocysteine lyase [bacterium P3]KWW40439.1 MAG: cysteine desulfurase / selenocysteine lyase [bacterium F083]